ATVRRLERGARLVVFDGDGAEADALLEVGEDGQPIVRIEAVRVGRTGGPVTLCYGLPKGDKLDHVLRQVTELGASRVLVVDCARSVVRLEGSRAEKRRARWRRVVDEAARQCGRADTPDVQGPLPLDAALERTADSGAQWLLDPAAGQDVASVPAAPPIAVWVGPEGGFSPEERGRIRAGGATAVQLACPVLRTETAAVTATALALHRAGVL
ncbi:MAG: RsmE family RNA methyltransferase, partial [Planctomycetota bacterium]